ncbi:DeoR family transcriptional regulator [Salmonella enterica subsp. arizonae]|nr:DeoR family transcriptional regulator [Salmonella enterica subsp. arizonae]
MKAAIERRMEILEVITRQGKARVEDLAERFNVSSVTIRSDLSFLEKMDTSSDRMVQLSRMLA